MSTVARQRSMTDRLIRHFGGNATVTLRKRNKLKNKASGSSAPTLTVSIEALTGASSLTIGATNLEGKVVKGSKLTIAGSATVYTVQAEATASANTVTLTLSPVLSQTAIAGAAVTFTQAYADYPFRKLRGEFKETDSETLREKARKIHLSAQGATVEPEVSDVILEGDYSNAIQKVDKVAPGTEVARYTVYLGELGNG